MTEEAKNSLKEENPQSRKEKILAKLAGLYDGETEEAQSRNEKWLLGFFDEFQKVKEASGSAARIEIVEALPETGEADVLYVVQVVTSKEYWKSMDSDEKVTIVTVTLTPYLWTHDRFVELVLNPLPNWVTYSEDDPARILNQPAIYQGLGDKSTRENAGSNPDGDNSHVEGKWTNAKGENAHAEGYYTTADGANSHSEGNSTCAKGEDSHAEGNHTYAYGAAQHTSGRYNIADKESKYVEIVGNGTYDSKTRKSSPSNARTLDWDGNEVLAGKLTLGAAPENDMDAATKKYVDSNEPDWAQTDSTKEGFIKNKPSIKAGTGENAVLEGGRNTASGKNAHAEGEITKASGDYSHAEGANTKATGICSHVEGGHSEANGRYSHAEGLYCIANGEAQHVFGRDNVVDDNNKYVEIVGIGYNDVDRINGRTLDWYGNEVLKGKLSVGAEPTGDKDVTTKKYVDDLVAALQAKIDALTPKA